MKKHDEAVLEIRKVVAVIRKMNSLVDEAYKKNEEFGKNMEDKFRRDYVFYHLFVPYNVSSSL